MLILFWTVLVFLRAVVSRRELPSRTNLAMWLAALLLLLWYLAVILVVIDALPFSATTDIAASIAPDIAAPETPTPAETAGTDAPSWVTQYLIQAAPVKSMLGWVSAIGQLPIWTCRVFVPPQVLV